MNSDYLIESCVVTFKDRGMTKALAEDVVRNIFEDIKQVLQSGGGVGIRGFGSFKVTEKAARTYTDPHGNKVAKGERRSPKFTPSKLLKELVNNGS